MAGGLSFAGVSAGNEYTCGVTTTKMVYCWGLNGGGRLGDGQANDVRLTPLKIALLFRSVNTSLVGSTTCGVNSESKSYCWGSNFSGQLGDGSSGRDDSTVPIPVAGPR